MKIVFVTPEFVTEESCFDGGLANYLFRVSLGLLELGHKPTIIVTSNTEEVILYKKIEVHRVYVKPQNYISTSLYWLYQSYILNSYISSIAKYQIIDIIQFASYTGVGFYRINNLPTVVRISSYNPLWSKYYNYNDSGENNKINYIESASIKKAEGVFGPSSLIAEKIYKNENIEVKVIESPFVPNNSKLDYSLSNQLKGKKYLLFFGTLGLLKGVKTIAEMLPGLLLKYTDINFVFVGKDAGFNGGKMIDYVYQKAGIYRNKIYYFDKMNHERLYPFIENAYAVVLPSQIDNFPNTCIEAMAHGKIVIGTKNTGFDQLVEDGQNGYLCERDNAKDLLFTIERVLLLSANEIIQIQNNAIKRIELLKPEYVVKTLVDFYNDIIEKYKQRDSIPIFENGIENTLLWDHINKLENKLAQQAVNIDSQIEITNSVHNSLSYRIGNKILRPISFLKNIFKCQK